MNDIGREVKGPHNGCGHGDFEGSYMVSMGYDGMRTRELGSQLLTQSDTRRERLLLPGIGPVPPRLKLLWKLHLPHVQGIAAELYIL